MTVSKAPDSDGDIKMVDMSGVFALAAALPEAKSLRSLRCARAPPNISKCQPPMNTLPSLARSLASNAICGVNKNGWGTYTAEGITALCQGLKGSAVTSLT